MRWRALVAVLLVAASARTVGADELLFPPVGGGGIPLSVPFPMSVGGTGNDQTAFAIPGCIESYFDGLIPKLRSTNLACGTGSGSGGGLTGVIDITQAPFSADKTGATCAEGAINTGIAALSGVTSGEVYAPAGKYKLCGPVLLHGASGDDNLNRNIYFHGAGPGATEFVSDTAGTGFAMFQVATPRTCTGGTGACDARINTSGRGAGCGCYKNTDCQSGSCAGGSVQREITIADLGIQLEKDNMVGLDGSLMGESVFRNVQIAAGLSFSHTNTICVLGSDGGLTVSGYSNVLTASQLRGCDVCVRLMPVTTDWRITDDEFSPNCGTGLAIDNGVNAVHVSNSSFQSTRVPVCTASACVGGYFHGKPCTVGADCGEADIIDLGLNNMFVDNRFEDARNSPMHLGENSTTTAACPTCGSYFSQEAVILGGYFSGSASLPFILETPGRAQRPLILTSSFDTTRILNHLGGNGLDQLVLEGTTLDANKTTLLADNPTAPRTQRFPDRSGNICVDSGSGCAAGTPGVTATPTPTLTVTATPIVADRSTPGIIAPVTPIQILDGIKELTGLVIVGPLPTPPGGTPTPGASPALVVNAPARFSRTATGSFTLMSASLTASAITPGGGQPVGYTYTGVYTYAAGAQTASNGGVGYITYLSQVDGSLLTAAGSAIEVGTRFAMTFTRPNGINIGSVENVRFAGTWNGTGSDNANSFTMAEFVPRIDADLTFYKGLHFRSKTGTGSIANALAIDIDLQNAGGEAVAFRMSGANDDMVVAGKIQAGNTSSSIESPSVGANADGFGSSALQAGTGAPLQTFLTNRLGSTATVGHLAILDTAHTTAATETTTIRSPLTVGVFNFAAPDLSDGRVATAGDLPVACTGTCAVGDYVFSSTTTGVAQCSGKPVPSNRLLGRALSTCSAGSLYVLLGHGGASPQVYCANVDAAATTTTTYAAFLGRTVPQATESTREQRLPATLSCDQVSICADVVNGATQKATLTLRAGASNTLLTCDVDGAAVGTTCAGTASRKGCTHTETAPVTLAKDTLADWSLVCTGGGCPSTAALYEVCARCWTDTGD